MMQYQYDVSIVIVCMNNLKMLYPCLESIKKYTTCTYEVRVTAYLFTPENLKKARDDFPWVTFIESNEIRGFSENNNLALRQAQGKYCFVLNDDTEMKMPVVDELVKTIESLPDDAAIVSPVTLYADGRVQCCGRPYVDWWTLIKSDYRIANKKSIDKYCNKDGIFQTYNILGAAFLIKKDIFEKVGWFDERYFFCPEDIALSDGLNKMGYKCYVNSDINITHYEGMSAKSLSMVVTCTKPAQAKGRMIFYSKGNPILYGINLVHNTIFSFLQSLYHYIKGCKEKRPNLDSILAIAYWHSCVSLWKRKSPKEIFSKYYLALKKEV